MGFKIPDIKKKIVAFLTEEDGSITKHAIIAAGVTAAMAGVANAGGSVTDTWSPSEGYCGNMPVKTQRADGSTTTYHHNGGTTASPPPGIKTPTSHYNGDYWDDDMTFSAVHAHCSNSHYNHASY